jgi:hypothetical protein
MNERATVVTVSKSSLNTSVKSSGEMVFPEIYDDNQIATAATVDGG